MVLALLYIAKIDTLISISTDKKFRIWKLYFRNISYKYCIIKDKKLGDNFSLTLTMFVIR